MYNCTPLINGVPTGYQRGINGVSRGITGYHGVSLGITGYHGVSRGINGGSKGDQRGINGFYGYTFIKHVMYNCTPLINGVSTGYQWGINGVLRGITGYHGRSTGDQRLLQIYFYQTRHVQLHPFDQRGINGVLTGYQRSITGYHGVSRGITGYHRVSRGITGDQRGIKGGSRAFTDILLSNTSCTIAPL